MKTLLTLFFIFINTVFANLTENKIVTERSVVWFCSEQYINTQSNDSQYNQNINSSFSKKKSTKIYHTTNSCRNLHQGCPIPSHISKREAKENGFMSCERCGN